MLLCLIEVKLEGVGVGEDEREIVQWDFWRLNRISPIRLSPSMGSEAGSGTVAFEEDRGPWNSDRLLSVFSIPDESAIHVSGSA